MEKREKKKDKKEKKRLKKEKKEKKKKEKKEKIKKEEKPETSTVIETVAETSGPKKVASDLSKAKGPMTKEEWEKLEKKRKMATNYAPDAKQKLMEANMREEKEKFGTEWTWLLSSDTRPPPHVRAGMKYNTWH